MSRPLKPAILVTGCSSGIGFELAKLLKARNYNVCITAREASIQNLRDQGFIDTDSFILRPLNVTHAEEREAVIEEMGWRWMGVDILINNAGVSYRSVVEHMTDEEESHQMDTNYFGPMGLIRLVLPHMRAQNWGRIINISSVSGMMAMPTMSSYSASKFALEGASEALWYELKPWNVEVSLLQPGFLKSDSFKHVILSQKASLCHEKGDEYSNYYSAMAPFVEKLMKRSLTSAEDIALRALNLIECQSPALRIPCTLDARIFYWLRRLLPRRLYHWALYRALPLENFRPK